MFYYIYLHHIISRLPSRDNIHDWNHYESHHIIQSYLKINRSNEDKIREKVLLDYFVFVVMLVPPGLIMVVVWFETSCIKIYKQL